MKLDCLSKIYFEYLPIYFYSSTVWDWPPSEAWQDMVCLHEQWYPEVSWYSDAWIFSWFSFHGEILLFHYCPVLLQTTFEQWSAFFIVAMCCEIVQSESTKQMSQPSNLLSAKPTVHTGKTEIWSNSVLFWLFWLLQKWIQWLTFSLFYGNIGSHISPVFQCSRPHSGIISFKRKMFWLRYISLTTIEIHKQQMKTPSKQIPCPICLFIAIFSGMIQISCIPSVILVSTFSASVSKVMVFLLLWDTASCSLVFIFLMQIL